MNTEPHPHLDCIKCGTRLSIDHECWTCDGYGFNGQPAPDWIETRWDTDNPDDEKSSWQPIDLTAAINGNGPEPPTVGAMTNNNNLFYDGRVHWIQGESESLKSWVAQTVAAQQLKADHRALWIDFEDDEHGVVSRLKALGVPTDIIANRFTYVRPDEPLRTSHAAYTAAWADLAALLDHNYTYAVIDGVTEAMTAEGLSMIDNADIASWMRLLPKHIARVTGAAVACIDHVVKNAEQRGRYAIGGQHKLAGVTGVTYRVTNTTPLSRAITDPIHGSSTIHVEKDRPGWVRGRTTGDEKTIAVLEITSYPDDSIEARLVPPDDATVPTPPWDLIERALQHLNHYDGAAKGAMEEAIGGRSSKARKLLGYLLDQGWIEVRKEGVAHRHYLTDTGRQQLT